MTCWEYKTIHSDEPISDDDLRLLGLECWILCAEMKTFTGRGYIARFRRALPSDHATYPLSGSLDAEPPATYPAGGLCRGRS